MLFIVRINLKMQYAINNVIATNILFKFPYFWLKLRSNGIESTNASRLYPKGLGINLFTTDDKPLTCMVGSIKNTNIKYQILRLLFLEGAKGIVIVEFIIIVKYNMSFFLLFVPNTRRCLIDDFV